MIAKQSDKPLNMHCSDPTDTLAPPGVRPDPVAGRGFWLLMVGSLIVVGTLAYLQFLRADAARHGGALSEQRTLQNLPVIAELPDFKLTDRSGRAVTRADLRGKIWVADFIFTTCGGPCPIMTRRMTELHQALVSRGIRDVVTVSFTVDPDTDTPPVLTEYAKQFNADSLDWLFLTGDVQAVYDLSIRGFKLHAAASNGDHAVEHSPRFILIDSQCCIRGYYEVVADEEMSQPRAEVMNRPMPRATRDRLLRDIQWLQREVRR